MGHFGVCAGFDRRSHTGAVAQPPGHLITRALHVERPDDGSDDADARSQPHWAWVLCVYRGCGSGGLTERLCLLKLPLIMKLGTTDGRRSPKKGFLFYAYASAPLRLHILASVHHLPLFEGFRPLTHACEMYASWPTRLSSVHLKVSN